MVFANFTISNFAGLLITTATTITIGIVIITAAVAININTAVVVNFDTVITANCTTVIVSFISFYVGFSCCWYIVKAFTTAAAVVACLEIIFALTFNNYLILRTIS